MDDFSKCSDCGIERTNPPKPGNCPCCFSAINLCKQRYVLFSAGTRITGSIYRCSNNKCRRVCSGDYLSGFWSGWQEKERQNGN